MGSRRSEILELKWEDIDLYNKQILTRRFKNCSTDLIPMHDLLYSSLIDYRDNCIDMSKGYIFTSSTGNRLSETSLSLRFQKAKEICNLEELTPKTLRKSFCTNLSAQGYSAKTIASITGHRDIQSLNYYIAVDSDIKTAAINASLKY